MGNIKQKIILAVIIATELLSVSKWMDCKQLLTRFSLFDIQLRLIESIHADKGQSLLITRIFHNKLLYGVLDIFNLYLQFLNVSFLAGIISLIGLIGVILGCYNFFSNKTKSLYITILIILFLLTPFLVLFDVLKSPILQFVVLSTPGIFLSLYGYNNFLKILNRKKYIFILFLIVISIWLYTNQIFSSLCINV